MSFTVRSSRIATASLGFLLMVGLLLIAPSPADAAPLTAADFAADCNDDGQVHVAGTQRYKGGSGSITGNCSVIHDPGAKLILRNVDLEVAGSLVAISSLQNATIKVIDSTIKAGDYLELTAGCCAGDSDVPEENGSVIVRRSVLSAQAIQLMASFDDPNGRVIVRESQLDATGSLGVQIRASDLAGINGKVRLVDTTITSAGDILVRTGTDGRTVARRNVLNAAGATTISTGTGGSCVSASNTPAVACS